jgi:chemotaxis signal transduction protein
MNTSTVVLEEKYITFKICDYLLALPVNSVFKVTICPPQFSQTLQNSKLAQMGQRTVMLINLYSYLCTNYNQHQPSDNLGRFLIVAQGSNGEFYGILADTPPSMLSICNTSTQPVPQTFHSIGLPTWVSKIAIVEQKGEPTTILMLDINKNLLN